MSVLILAFGSLVFLMLLGYARPYREAALAAFTAVSALLLFITEALSPFAAITQAWLTLAWATAAIATGVAARRRIADGAARIIHSTRARFSSRDWVFTVLVSVFLLGTLASATLYPTTNYDSLSYHMPRVFFWAQHQSVEHYPTVEGRQLFSSPLLEYAILHSQVLAGGNDGLANLPQWLAYVFSLVAVSSIAERLGVTRRGQQAAVLAAASMPMALLQASTTQNDLTAGVWCLTAVYCLTGMLRRPTEGSELLLSIWAALAAGLAVQAKPTAMIVLGPFAVWMAAHLLARRRAGRTMRILGLMLAVFLMVNAGWYVRNARTLDGDFLALRAPSNEHLLVQLTTPADLPANMLKNAAMLAATPIEGLNELKADAVLSLAALIGAAPPKPPGPEFDYGEYEIPRSIWNHDFAGAPVTLLLLMVSSVFAFAMLRTNRLAVEYVWVAWLAFCLQCAVIAWQPWINRLTLPSVLALTPIVGLLFGAGQMKPRGIMRGVALSLLALSIALGLLVMLFNVTNRLVPMEGSFWNTSYLERRFQMLPQTQEPFLKIREAASGNGIEVVGVHQHFIDFPIYPLLAIMPDVQFGYVQNTVLPDRISEPSVRPEATVEVMWSSDYVQSEKSELRHLIPPQRVGDMVILFYTN